MSIKIIEPKLLKHIPNKILESKEKVHINTISIHESRLKVANAFKEVGESTSVPYYDEKFLTRDGYHLSLRIYNYHLPPNSPIFIYYMGNGYIYDLFQINSNICSRIAENSAIKIGIVNSRLAPEKPLPIAIYDSYDAVKYIATHADHFKIDPNKITIGGFCSGATCAIAVADIAFKEKIFKINHLILLNGIYDLTYTHNHYVTYEEKDKSFTKEALDYIIEKQNLSVKDRYNPLYSPLYHKTLSHLPSTTILVAEYDRNRSNSAAFYEKLNADKVQVEEIILSGQTHNTIIFRTDNEDNEDPAIIIANILKKKCGKTLTL